MRTLGWIFLLMALASVFSGKQEVVSFLCIMGTINMVGADIIRAIQQGDK